MTEIAVRVQQQSDVIAVDGAGVTTVRGDREGALFTGDIHSKYMQWLLAGKIFETHQAVVGTPITVELNAAYDPLEPFWRATVPSSITCVPIAFRVWADTDVAATDFMTITVHDTDTFASGGLAGSAVQPLFIDNQGAGNPKTSVLTNVLNADTPLTEAAATNLRFIHMRTPELVTDHFMLQYNVLRGDPVFAVSGPASIIVTADSAATEEVYYSMIWAELDKNYLVNR